MLISGKLAAQLIDQNIWEAYQVPSYINISDNKNLSLYENKIYSDSLTINPNSIDVRLGHIIKYPVMDSYDNIIDLKAIDNSNIKWLSVDITDGLDLYPGCPILGFAQERFITPPFPQLQNQGIAQCYEGRSTMARLFIQSHMTAGFGDIGFCSNFTLEIINNFNRPIRIYPGIRIGQIYFNVVYGEFDQYHGSYNNQELPQIPKLALKNIF